MNVDLADTAHAGTTRDWSQVERSKHDWIHWRVHQDRFEAACGPTNLNEAILAFLDLVGRELRSEPRTNAAAPPAHVERIRAYHGLPEPMRAAWLEPTSPLTPTCNGLIETTDRFLRAAQDQGLAKESLQASDLYLAALAVAWAEDAPTATTATGHVLSTMLRRGWSTAS